MTDEEPTSHFDDSVAGRIVETIHEPLLVLDEDFRIVRANPSFHRTYEVPREDVVGRPLFELGQGEWDVPELRDGLRRVLEEDDAVEGLELDRAFPGQGRRVMRLRGRMLRREGTESRHFLVAIEDITEQRKLEEELRRHLSRHPRPETRGGHMRSDSDAGPRRRAARILLVEDNPADVRLTREMLRESKVRNDLLVANTAEEAGEILGLEAEATEKRPDLVLLDLNLPGKSGHELLEELKGHPELRRIPVVILSSSEAEEDVVKSYDRYANAYVTKPVDLDGISKIVRAVDDFWFEVVRLPDEGS